MGNKTLSSILSMMTIVAFTGGCADELMGLSPELSEVDAADFDSALEQQRAALCANQHCEAGFACEVFDPSDDGTSGHLEPICVEIQGPKCQDVTCGPAAECQMLEGTAGDVIPQCVPLACDAAPPADSTCPATCATGYLMAASGTTCSCCSPADEPTPELCLDDSDCGTGETCDDVNFCETVCEPGKPCSTQCWGRCAAVDLVANPNRWQP